MVSTAIDVIAALARRTAVFALVFLGFNQPAYSDALEGPFYREAYAGETVYPTSPEKDRLGLGGMFGYVIGSKVPLGPIPTLGPDGALAQAVSVGGADSATLNELAATGIVSPINNLISRKEPFAAFGHFDAFSVTPASGSVGWAVGAGGLTTIYVSAGLPYNINVSLFEFVAPWSGEKFPSLSVGESGGSFQAIPVPVTVEGLPFDLVLVVDPTGSGTAKARLTINGRVFETPAINLVGYNDGQVFDSLSQAVLIQNNYSPSRLDWGAGDTVSAQFRGLCISGLADKYHACPALNQK